MKVVKEFFGHINEETVDLYTLENDHGMSVSCMTLGCIITKIMTPDRDGTLENVVIGYDSVDEYLTDSYYLGAVIGRFAGRIAGASFELDGVTYPLAKNNNGNHLHGGLKGFDKVIWDAEVIEREGEAGVQFSYFSPDGEEGYPGNLNVSVLYTLNNQNELTIRYTAKSDQKTVLNMTNHSYFNLSGNLQRDTLDHSLQLKSSKYLELNDELLPLRVADVQGTPFDFKAAHSIREGAESSFSQNKLAGEGYDHPFILDTNHDHEIVLKEEQSGRSLTIETDEVAVVLYSGTQIQENGEIRGVPARKYLGLCLETQGLPDAVHHPEYPSCWIEKDVEVTKATTYKFGTF
ncbi:aldose epimerase family protein [Robertmurraya korlensis]|uniref:aldose epimerase family protein n=1 Tax=Robertmurraya korlensis TaxID=519977 RepID=UPI00082657E0|nr:aldose epimerase family protein [Robertmurraya korlensis]